MRILAICAASLLLFAACKEETSAPARPKSPSTKRVKYPLTAKDGADVLYELADAIEANDYDKAVACFWNPPEILEEMKDGPIHMGKIGDISRDGVDRMLREGQWGKLAKVWSASKAEFQAERAGVAVEECWGLKLRFAEAGFYWTGTELKLIRVDNVAIPDWGS